MRNRRMKRVVVLMVVMGIATFVSGQTMEPLTFDQAIQISLTQNPEIKAATYEEEVAVKERKAAYGLRLPQANITGAYIYMGDDMSIDMNDLKIPVNGILGGLPEGLLPPAVLQQAAALMSSDWAMKLQDRSLGTVAANITVPLYTGGKINAANNAAKIKVNQARQKGSQTRNALISELTERYFGLALALQVIEVRKQVVDGMHHHLSDAIALEKNGIIAKGERLYAEVHAAEAEREYLAAQKTAQTLVSALGNTLNVSDSIAYRPVSDMFILDQIEPVDYFKQCAADQNPLLKQVNLAKQLAQENIRLTRADFAPQVALMGIASLYNYQVTPILPKWAVGAGVSFKIFDGLNREYKFSAARTKKLQVDALDAQANNDMMTLIDKLYNEMITYSQQMPSIDASFRFAEEYLRIKEEAFKEGAAPSSDVVDARLNLAKIKIERLQAAYYYDLMLARLLEAAGISESFTDYAQRSAARPVRFEESTQEQE